MGREFIWLGLVAIMICFITSDVLGCTCFHYPQYIFCISNFVFVGKVQSEEFVKGTQPDPEDNKAIWKYRVNLITRIKGLSNVAIGSNVEIQTPGNGGLCGVRLTVGQRYILSGSNNNGKRTVISCGIIAKEHNLSFEQMRYLFATNSNSYSRNCACEVVPKDSNSVVSSTSGCRVPDDEQCYFKTALCIRQNGTCKWINADCS